MQASLLDIMLGLAAVTKRSVQYIYVLLCALILAAYLTNGFDGFRVSLTLGGAIAFSAWYAVRKSTWHLPFLLVYLLTAIIWYLLPVAVNNEALTFYTVAEWQTAAVQIFSHLLALLASYHLAPTKKFMRMPGMIRQIDFVALSGATRSTVLLLVMFILIVVFAWMRIRTDILFGIIPASLNNVAATFVTVLASGLVVLLGYRLHRHRNLLFDGVFWGCWIFFVMVQASGLILAGTVVFIVATFVGLVLGRRRVPWVYLLITAALLSFLNQGKFEMRQKYWEAENSLSLIELYSEWTEESYDLLTGQKVSSQVAGVGDAGQSLIADRLSNMQMLLYVQDQVVELDVPLLWGETYAYAPLLLVPRFLWPNKPIAHQSQIKLNTHFGRSLYEYEHEKKTYIAWGLLPEAYGNFGPYLGPVISGVFLGFLLKYLAVFALRYPLFSLKSITAFTLLAMSFSWPVLESSVMFTSSVQVVALILILGYPVSQLKKSEPASSGTAPSKGAAVQLTGKQGRV